MSEEITFKDLVEIVETAFRERYLSALLETLSKIVADYEYYLNVRHEDVIYGYYDTSSDSLWITLVLRSCMAIKVGVDREKDSDKIRLVRVWVVPVE